MLAGADGERDVAQRGSGRLIGSVAKADMGEGDLLVSGGAPRGPLPAARWTGSGVRAARSGSARCTVSSDAMASTGYARRAVPGVPARMGSMTLRQGPSSAWPAMTLIAILSALNGSRMGRIMAATSDTLIGV